MNVKKKARTAAGVIRREGALGFTIIALQKIKNRQFIPDSQKKTPQLMVRHDDLLKADPRKPVNQPTGKEKTSYVINWVMSPPGKGSGGHQNIYRFINFLEQKGHKCNIYVYSTLDKRTIPEIQSVLGDSYADVKAAIKLLPADRSMEEADAIFATGWETAYPVYNSSMKVKKLYFVQDFEPFFYPIGSENILAENSYRFGFTGITAGGWLAHKLSKDYGMKTDHFDFSAERSLYSFENSDKRKEIFFYARPVTARRGFELGVAALELFHKKHPEYTINLAGWDVSDYNLPFPYVNLKTLELEQLTGVYNKCAAALVMSLTNMSLLPLELLACGTIPVVNDGDNNRMVSNNPFIAYADNSPLALAEKLIEVINKPNLNNYAREAAASIPEDGWDQSGKKFVEIVEKELGDA